MLDKRNEWENVWNYWIKWEWMRFSEKRERKNILSSINFLSWLELLDSIWITHRRSIYGNSLSLANVFRSIITATRWERVMGASIEFIDSSYTMNESQSYWLHFSSRFEHKFFHSNNIIISKVTFCTFYKTSKKSALTVYWSRPEVEGQEFEAGESLDITKQNV